MNVSQQAALIRDEVLRDHGLQWLDIVTDLAKEVVELNSQMAAVQVMVKSLGSRVNHLEIAWEERFCEGGGKMPKPEAEPVVVKEKRRHQEGRSRKAAWPRCLEDTEQNKEFFDERRSFEFRSTFGEDTSSELSDVKCMRPGCREKLTKHQVWTVTLFHSRQCAAIVGSQKVKYRDIGRRLEDTGFTTSVVAGEGVRGHR